MFRKLVPVLSALLLAGPVFAADAPSSSSYAPGATAYDGVHHPRHHRKRHHHRRHPHATSSRPE